MASAREMQLEEALKQAQAVLAEQNELLERINSAPLIYGSVIDLEDDSSQKMTVATEKQLYRVIKPNNVELSIGDWVCIHPMSMAVIEVMKYPIALGPVSYVRNVIDEFKVELEGEGGNIRQVLSGKVKNIQPGDRVLMDASGLVVLINLGKKEERFSFDSETDISWDSIGGLYAAKQEMIEIIEAPHKNRDIYLYYKKKPVHGVLLYGPPGCGKTMLGKATATALARIYQAKTNAGFMYVKGPEILDRYVGVAEATIRSIFARAKDHKREKGYPAVVFVDEADAILGKRGSGISSDMEKTIVPMFLTEMDGLEESGAVVILATNRPDVLDPAVIRDGRVDRKIKITRPDVASAADIFELNLKNVPLCNGYTSQDLSQHAARSLYSANRVLYNIELNNGTKIPFTVSDITNGGMIAAIVDQATTLAIRRDMQNGKPGGLAKDDLDQAIEGIAVQQYDINHGDDIENYIESFRGEVSDVKKVPLERRVPEAA